MKTSHPSHPSHPLLPFLASLLKIFLLALFIATLFGASTAEKSFSKDLSFQTSRKTSKVRFASQDQVKALLLRSIRDQVWRGRYKTGRLRMTFPQDFPQTGRASVRSVLWDEKSRRFSVRLAIEPSHPFEKEDRSEALRERLVSLSGHAIPYVRVLAARHTLLYGTRLRRADLKIIEIPDSKKLRSALTHLNQAIGKEMRSRRRAGAVLRLRDLRPARLVQRRSTVQVTYNEGGVRVVLQALALSDGVHGETVRLRNKFSGREFSAVVDGAGHATVHQGSGAQANTILGEKAEPSIDSPTLDSLGQEEQGKSLVAKNPFRAHKQRQYDKLLNDPLQKRAP